jgi:hypothetical protein
VLEDSGAVGDLVEVRGQGEIVESRWSAFGRTDMVASSLAPNDMAIYIDGTAGSSMYKFSGDVEDPGPAFEELEAFSGNLPFRFLRDDEKDSMLSIGPGGGRDVLLALTAGVGRVVAVEVNADLVDIVREYAWFNGGIFSGISGVEVVVDEGRNYLKRQDEAYDLIMLSLPVTRTSRSPDGFALTESYLLTTDSVLDYVDHLTDEGRLIIVGHDLLEVLRAASVSLEALDRTGVAPATALKQVYWIASEQYPVFVLRKTPFEPAEMRQLHRLLHEQGHDLNSSYIPTIEIGDAGADIEANGYAVCSSLLPLDAGTSPGGLSFGGIVERFSAQGLDISPVTDDSPFFFKFETGIPDPVAIVLGSSSVMVLLAVAAPLLLRRRARPPGRLARLRRRAAPPGTTPSPARFLVLFVLLGAGFMLAEISLVQKLVLFLGQPVLALAVLLASLLTGLGVGSLYSGRIDPQGMARAIGTVSVSITVVLVGYALLVPMIFDQLLGSALAVRLLVAGLMLIPLGFLMGFPFPLGVRLLKERGMEGQIPWMLGVNGASSVMGSATAVALATTLGLTAALVAAAVCYLAVFLTFGGYGRVRDALPGTGGRATRSHAGPVRRRGHRRA